jgi:hypothetical protein
MRKNWKGILLTTDFTDCTDEVSYLAHLSRLWRREKKAPEIRVLIIKHIQMGASHFLAAP